MSGFFIYYFYIRKNRSLKWREKSDSLSIKTIPEDVLIKIVTKIKNHIVLLTAKKYDISNQYDPEEFYKQILNDKAIESLIYDSKYESLINSKGFTIEEEKENYKKEYTENLLKSITAKLELIRTLGDNFNQDTIINFEFQVLKNFGYTRDEYVSAIKENMNNKDKIYADIKLIKRCKQHLSKNELIVIDFDRRFKENYFKIIHNIYYLTLRKMQIIFIDDYINKEIKFNNFNDILFVLAHLFDKNIKEVRNEVFSFFQIPDHTLLDHKTMLSLYYFYISPYHPWRIKLDKLNVYMEDIRHEIANGYIYSLFLKNEVQYSKPTDGIIDFDHLVQNKVKGRDVKIII